MLAHYLLQAAIESDVPVLIWGPPGQAKTSIVQAYARETSRACVVLIGETIDSVDIAGIPRVLSTEASEEPVADYVPLRLFASLCAHDCPPTILFLDELTCARPSVQAALLALINERRAGQRYLNSRVRIVAAANPPRYTPSGWELSPATCNRFLHVDWDYSISDWLRYVRSQESPQFAPRCTIADEQWSHVLVRDHIRPGNSLYNRLVTLTGRVTTGEIDLERAYPTPRSLSLYLRLLDTLQTFVLPDNRLESLALEAANGTVGRELALELAAPIHELVTRDTHARELVRTVLAAHAQRDPAVLRDIDRAAWPRLAQMMTGGDAHVRAALEWSARTLCLRDILALVQHLEGERP